MCIFATGKSLAYGAAVFIQKRIIGIGLLCGIAICGKLVNQQEKLLLLGNVGF